MNAPKSLMRALSFWNSNWSHLDMSRAMRKPTMWFPKRSDTNRAVQAQKMVRDWKFLDLESRGIVLS